MAKGRRRKDIALHKQEKKQEDYLKGSGMSSYARRLAFRNKNNDGRPLPLSMVTYAR